MSNDTQSVAENSDLENTNSNEQVGAQESLDDLFSEYEAAHQPQPKVESPNDDIKALAEWARNEQQRTAKQAEIEAINNAVKTLKDSMGVSASDRIVKGLLLELASERPQLAQAFNNRENDPGTWNRALKAAAKDLKKEFETDSQATNDREVVASAVRSASTAKPAQEEKVDFTRMNARELDAYLRGQR